MRKPLRIGLMVCLAAAVSPVSAAIKLPHVVHDNINLRPQQCMAPHDVAVWKNRVYVTGHSTTGAGPNVWCVDATDPDNLQYRSASGVGFKAYGCEASGGKLYTASWFEGMRIYDITTDTLALTGAYDPAAGAFWSLDVKNGRVYVTQGTETTSSLHLVNVANASTPTQFAYFNTDEGLSSVVARGSYLYVSENHHSMTPRAEMHRLNIYNISDESNPYLVKRLYSRHECGGLALRGDYLYMSWSESLWINWEGGSMPTQNGDFPWSLFEGSEIYATVQDGPYPPSGNKMLHIDDNSTAAGSRVRWARNWYAIAADGTTVVARARCLSAGGDVGSINNIVIDDGTHRERVRILTNRIDCLDSGLTYYLDATQWHTYQITTRGDTITVYLDESRNPILTGTMTGASTGNRIVFGGGADGATQQIDFDYVRFNGQEDMLPRANGGIEVYDISDPINPVLVGTYAGTAGGTPRMLGDYIFYGTGGNGFMTIDISDPLNPHSVYQGNVDGYELCLAGNGRYVYIGSLAGDWEGTLYAIEAFDSDPDRTPPSTWSGFSLGDASWDVEYLGESLPTASKPAWSIPVGYTESLGSAGGGVLRVNDDSASAKAMWVRNWDATNTRGGTVLFRAKCQSFDLNGGSISNLNNLIVEDGKYQLRLAVLPDRIRNVQSGEEYLVSGPSEWHTYRVTTKGSSYQVFMDEAAVPVLSGLLTETTNRARVWFGSSSTQSLQDISFDFVQCCSSDAYGPAGRTNNQAPTLSVSVDDWVDNDSVSGIDPTTAMYYWSTDGGLTWSPSGWDCTYEADLLPTASTPAWQIEEGNDSCASVEAGLLRINDTSTASGSKVKWSRNWGASPANGTTVLVRARCVATGGDTYYTGNIFIEDGSRREAFKILTDRVAAMESGATYMLDGTQWHTYRVTTKGDSYKLYVDENPVPVLSGAMVAATSANRVMFGSGASAGTQEIYFDYVYYTSLGDLAPGESGGGAGQPALCSAVSGDYTATLTAPSVPFGQDSETLNKIRFRVRDMAGNVSTSPVYNVRISGNAGPKVVSVTCPETPGTYRLGQIINVQVNFDTNVVVTGSPRIKLNPVQGGKWVSYTSGSGTASLRFSYVVALGDSADCLDYVARDALILNGGTIKDVWQANADLALPEPGSVNSLCARGIAVDAVRPMVTSASSDLPDGAYKAGDQIDVILTFSEPVVVTGTPQLELETGATDRKAVYTSGSGSAALTFMYTVQAGDASPDLDYKAANSLTGVIKDLAGNSFNTTLPSPGTPASLGSNKNIVIDTVAPTVTSISPPSVSLARTGPVSWSVSFDEPVTGFDSTDDIEVNAGTATVESIAISGSDAGPYTVTVSGLTGGGTLGISVKAGACTDAAGNPNTASSASQTVRVISADGSIAEAKRLSDGTTVELGNKALYLKWPEFGYIEEPDRSAGVRIEGTITPSQDSLVCLTGTIQTTPGGERYIQLADIASSGSAGVTALGLCNRALESALADGLFVKTWGIVQGAPVGNTYVVSDGSDAAGVRIITQGVPGVSDGEFVKVSGAAGHDGARVIYAR